MTVSSINNSRRPYKLEYYDDKGQKQVIHRRPPPLLHRLLPEDEVKITRKKSEYWDEGDEVTVAASNPRQPNTLRVENSDGRHTFLSHRDVEFVSRDGEGPEVFDRESDPIGTRYLLWP